MAIVIMVAGVGMATPDQELERETEGSGTDR